MPATELAMTHIGRPVPNAALLGGFAALSGQVSLASMTEAIGRRFAGAVAAGNFAAATAAYEFVRAEQEELSNAQTD
jgi:pyruvate ferredoxin oxidoreductase gamma subunit